MIMQKISGTASGDVINGTIKGDIILSLGGDDTVSAKSGNDTVYLGGGNDVAYLGLGDDIAYGAGGDDRINGGDGNDTIGGGDGNDRLSAGAGNDTVWAGAGNDNVSGAAGNDDLWGGDGNDTVDGGVGDDIVGGGDGNDQLMGGTGTDVLYGGDGQDQLTGGAGNDILYGAAGTDTAFYAGTVDALKFVSRQDGGVDVISSAGDGVDTLYGIEFLNVGGTVHSLSSLLKPDIFVDNGKLHVRGIDINGGNDMYAGNGLPVTGFRLATDQVAGVELGLKVQKHQGDYGTGIGTNGSYTGWCIGCEPQSSRLVILDVGDRPECPGRLHDWRSYHQGQPRCRDMGGCRSLDRNKLEIPR